MELCSMDYGKCFPIALLDVAVLFTSFTSGWKGEKQGGDRLICIVNISLARKILGSTGAQCRQLCSASVSEKFLS